MVVRYLTGDPPEMAARAAGVIDREDGLKLTAGVLMETAYVLASVYEIERAILVDNLMAFVQKENISPMGIDKRLILQALLLCRRSGRVSYADAMLWAAARSTPEKVVYSLDEGFPSDGVEVRTG